MRFYSFVNMYLSNIQKGIQTAHLISEMSVKYQTETNPSQIYIKWAEDHKTIIVLNGGFSSNLRDLYEFFESAPTDYPFCRFNESDEAMDGMLTSVGIILPPKIYAIAQAYKRNDVIKELVDTGELFISPENTIGYNATKETLLSFNSWEQEMISTLGGFSLA